jgi:hypothetical protein
MVTHHELGEISHNRDEEYDERRVVETPPGLTEIVRILMEELQRCKDDNERLIKEQEKQTEINAVLLQILSYIQRQTQHGPTSSHVDRHHTKKTQSPPEIQNHGPESGHTRRRTSKKAQHGAKGHSSEESSGEETENSKESSSRKTSFHSQRKRKKRKHSKIHDLEEFNKEKPPTFYGEINKGEEEKFWLPGLKKYVKFHDYSENLKV